MREQNMYVRWKVDRVIDLFRQKKLSGAGKNTNKKQIILSHKAPNPWKALFFQGANIGEGITWEQED